MKKIFFLLIIFMLITSCASKKNPNNITLEEIRWETDNLEVRIIALMEKADTPYSEHEAEAEQLTADIMRHYNRVKQIENSEFALKQWNVLLTEEDESLLLVRYLKQWQHEGTLDKKTKGIGLGNARLVLRNIKIAEAQL